MLYHRGGGVANAVACTTTAKTSITVSSSSDPSEVSSLFDCEGGVFDVTWSGVVNVEASIKIGQGTTVSISGDHASDATVADPTSSIGRDSSSAVNSNGSSAAVALNRFGPVFLVERGTLNLAGIAVREGGATSTAGLSISGGGISAEYATVTATNCTFEDNFAEWVGGGIFANWSTVEVRDTVFRRCSAGDAPEATEGTLDVIGAGGGIGVSLGVVGVVMFVSHGCWGHMKSRLGVPSPPSPCTRRCFLGRTHCVARRLIFTLSGI